MPATTAQNSVKNMHENATRLRKSQDGLWKIAKKSPMFSVVKQGSSGKEYTQYSRLVNSQAYKVACSGACAAVAAELQIDMAHLGMDFTPDSKTRPWACQLSPGAAFMLEQFLATIVQQVVYQARTVRNGIKKHSRNHKEVIKLAIDEVRKSIFEPASGVPTSTTALPMSIARKKKEGESEAPGEKEAESAPAADDDEEEEEEGDAAADDDEA